MFMNAYKATFGVLTALTTVAVVAVGTVIACSIIDDKIREKRDNKGKKEE